MKSFGCVLIRPGRPPKLSLLPACPRIEVGRARGARRLDAAFPAVPPYPKTAPDRPVCRTDWILANPGLPGEAALWARPVFIRWTRLRQGYDAAVFARYRGGEDRKHREPSRPN